jgi:hypothetical protein
MSHEVSIPAQANDVSAKQAHQYSGVILRGLDAMMEFANAIAKTEVVPAAFRGKPDSIVAVIQTGLEMGLTPMASLRSFNNIQGTVVLKPECALGLIRSKGLLKDYSITHTGEGNSLAVTVSGQRVGDSREYSVRFSWADAVQAQLHTKEMYKRWPLRMLTARAVGFFCKDLFPDVLSGLPIAEADDISDASQVPSASTPPTQQNRTATSHVKTSDNPKLRIVSAARKVQKVAAPPPPVPTEAVVVESSPEPQPEEEGEEEGVQDEGQDASSTTIDDHSHTDEEGRLYPEYVEGTVASLLERAKAMSAAEVNSLFKRLNEKEVAAANAWKPFGLHADPKINKRLMLLLASEGFLPPNCNPFTLPGAETDSDSEQESNA